MIIVGLKLDGHIRVPLFHNLKLTSKEENRDSESRVVKGWKYIWFIVKYAIIGKFHCDLPFKTKISFHIFRYIIILFLFFSIVFTASEINLAYMKTKDLLNFKGEPTAVKTLMNDLVNTKD